MTHAPNRRWFHWSLRTLFVVVALVAVFMWEVYSVRERRRIWLDVNNRGGYTLTNGITEEIPIIRFINGKRAHSTLIVVPVELFSEYETEHIRAMFSESAVTIVRCPQKEVRGWRNKPPLDALLEAKAYTRS